jgi:YgiT-type zinc finger domain-containing protein
MSSSRQSSRAKRKLSIGQCPSCGSDNVAEVVEDVVIRIGRRSHRFEQVAHERCASCGERIFGIETSKQFDATILKRRRRAA